jgi:hypothetical protein
MKRDFLVATLSTEDTSPRKSNVSRARVLESLIEVSVAEVVHRRRDLRTILTLFL